MRTNIALVTVLCLMPTIARAVCPTPTVVYGWPYGIPVHYAWGTYTGAPAYSNLGVPNLGIESPIHDAFNSWTYANQNQNPSNITFYWSTTGAIRVYAVQVNSPGVPGEDPGVAAQYTMAVWSGTSQVASQDITLYHGALVSGVPLYDQGAANYHTFITKLLLHEVGHGMYLTDQLGNPCGGQVAGQSVMNGICGTNDSVMNNLPTTVQSCDNASIH